VKLICERCKATEFASPLMDGHAKVCETCYREARGQRAHDAFRRMVMTRGITEPVWGALAEFVREAWRCSAEANEGR